MKTRECPKCGDAAPPCGWSRFTTQVPDADGHAVTRTWCRDCYRRIIGITTDYMAKLDSGKEVRG